MNESHEATTKFMGCFSKPITRAKFQGDLQIRDRDDSNRLTKRILFRTNVQYSIYTTNGITLTEIL